jgi:hypothetical protein
MEAKQWPNKQKHHENERTGPTKNREKSSPDLNTIKPWSIVATLLFGYPMKYSPNGGTKTITSRSVAPSFTATCPSKHCSRSENYFA